MTRPTSNDKCVIRLTTTAWADHRGLHTKKSLLYLRRKSSGYNILEEYIGASGELGTASIITNLNACEDGVYEVVPCELSDDDYSLKLIKII